MPVTHFRRHLLGWLGLEFSPVSHAERLVSALGAFLGISAAFLVSSWTLGPQAALPVIASMGASAVLLFAAPHGALSQPWPLLVGHLVSALLGVSCARWLPPEWWTAALAVALAIAAMHYLRCLHPPGGATALVAVVGGPEVHALGYQFVFSPVLLNALSLLLIALGFNYLFHWRRYPAYSARPQRPPTAAKTTAEPISHQDFVYALSQINSFIDVTENDLLQIYELATHRRTSGTLQAEELRPGGYYSNAKFGHEWEVRQIIEASDESDPALQRVVYKCVAGQHRRRGGSLSRQEFAHWARYEVILDEENWKRIGRQEPDTEE